MDWADHSLGAGGQLDEVQNTLLGLGRDPVWVDFTQLCHTHHVGKDLNFFLGQGGDLLDLREGSGLVHGVQVGPSLMILGKG